MPNERVSLRSPWAIVCLALCLAGLVFNLTGYPLLDPDEGRNAEVAREMASTGDYVLPHLNGLPYLDKPMLYFAAGAVTMKVLGPTTLAARLPSLLFTLATIALVAWFALSLFGSNAVLPAAVATAATPFTLAYARVVIFDSALAFFVVLATAALYLAMEERLAPSKGKSEGWTALAWVAMGLGVLTKGPIAIALPLMVAIPFGIRYRCWRALSDPISVALFFLIIGPWILAVSLRIPDFLEYALVTETVRRFSTSELERTGPLWYFLPILPAAALPWSLVVLGGGKSIFRMRDENGLLDRRVVFLLLWIAVPLVFFTLSQSKRPQYILPLIPAVSLLVAGMWHRRDAGVPGVRFAATGMMALGVFFLLAHRIIPGLVPASPAVAATIPGTALILGAACFVGGLLAWFAHRKRVVLLLAFSLPVAAIPISSQSLMRELGRERSSFLLAEAVESAAGNAVRVVGIGAYPLSLPFYLRRTIMLSSIDGSELTSNYVTRHLGDIQGLGSPLQDADWWKEALVTCTQPTVFIAPSDDDALREILRSSLSLIMDSGKYSAYGPCGPETFASAGR